MSRKLENRDRVFSLSVGDRTSGFDHAKGVGSWGFMNGTKILINDD